MVSVEKVCRVGITEPHPSPPHCAWWASQHLSANVLHQDPPQSGAASQRAGKVPLTTATRSRDKQGPSYSLQKTSLLHKGVPVVSFKDGKARMKAPDRFTHILQLGELPKWLLSPIFL